MTEQTHVTGPIEPSPELAESMAKFEKAFETRLGNVPYEWRGPLVDVLDTYEICMMKLIALQGGIRPSECIELTRLVLMQKIRIEDKQERDERSESDA